MNMSKTQKDIPPRINLEKLVAITSERFRNLQLAERLMLLAQAQIETTEHTAAPKKSEAQDCTNGSRTDAVISIFAPTNLSEMSDIDPEETVLFENKLPLKLPKRWRKMRNAVTSLLVGTIMATSSGFAIPAHAQEPTGFTAAEANRVFLPIANRYDLSPEEQAEIEWNRFVELMHEITGKGFLSGNPAIRITDAERAEAVGKNEFVAVANQMLILTTNYLEQWTTLRNEKQLEGFKPSRAGYSPIYFQFTSEDTAWRQIVDEPISTVNDLEIKVEKNKIFSVARAIAELVVPPAMLDDGLHNSEALRQAQVNMLTIEIAKMYQNKFVKNAELGVDQPQLLFFDEQGNPVELTTADYLARMRGEMERLQIIPLPNQPPIPAEVVITNGVQNPTFQSTFALSYEGSMFGPTKNELVQPFAQIASRIFNDALNEFEQNVGQIPNKEFLAANSGFFQNGEDDVWNWAGPFYDLMGWTEFRAFLKKKYEDAGFVLTSQEAQQQLEEIKDAPRSDPRIVKFFPFGNIGSPDGITIISFVQSASNFQNGSWQSRLDSFEGVAERCYPESELHYSITSPRTGIQYRARYKTPPSAIRVPDNHHSKITFPSQFTITETDGQQTLINLTNTTVPVRLILSQVEPDKDGNKRTQKFEQFAHFGTDQIQAALPTSQEENTQVPTVDVIPGSESF
jgi:hypothetical protein